MSAPSNPLPASQRSTDSTREAARARIDRIAAHVAASWDDIIAAHRGRDWLALGYDSWADLCDAEFRGATLALPREERREVVRGLTEAGLSTRAIGTALGVAQDTVRRDQQAGERNRSPEPTPVTGLDGKIYTPRSRPQRVTVDGATGEIVGTEAPPRQRALLGQRDREREQAAKFSRDVAFALSVLWPLAMYEERRKQLSTLRWDEIPAAPITPGVLDQAQAAIDLIRDTFYASLGDQ